MNKIIRYLLVGGLLASLSLPVCAQTRVQVGQFVDDGQIQLANETFRARIGNAVISVLGTQVQNGVIHAWRKAYDENQACINHILALVDEDGNPIQAGVLYPDGTPVHFDVMFETLVFGCRDDGCHALLGLQDVFGNPAFAEASCDMTELSDGNCRCHVRDAPGSVQTPGTYATTQDLCNSIVATGTIPLNDWIKPQYLP